MRTVALNRQSDVRSCYTVAMVAPGPAMLQEVRVSSEALRTLVMRWRDDPGGTYRTWFLWEERLKNFRSIRRGIQQVVQEIEAGTFGNQYRGSSLETSCTRSPSSDGCFGVRTTPFSGSRSCGSPISMKIGDRSRTRTTTGCMRGSKRHNILWQVQPAAAQAARHRRDRPQPVVVQTG